MAYTNSPLVTYTNITKNKTKNRNHAIDTITIHCIVGQWTAKQGCDYFATTTRQCSANYVVGKDGSIGLSVDEKDRSWCTSSASNDNRAVTIECASDATHPYAVTDAAYNALIKLVADICKRNNIETLIWSTNKTERMSHLKGCNMTVHRDFAAKSCPGDYLYNRHAEIASKVNAILGSSWSYVAPTQPNSTALYRVQTGAFSKKANAEVELKKVKAAGFDAIIVQVDNLYKVQVGAYANYANATAIQSKLKIAGFATMITTKSGNVVSTTTTTKPVTVGATVKVNKGAKTYTGGSLASFVYDRNHHVDSVNGNRVVISYQDIVVCAINANDLTVI